MQEDNSGWTFSLVEALLLTHILAINNTLKLKFLNDGFGYYKHTFIDGLEWCGLHNSMDLLWCFYQLFGLSFWRHPFTAEDPLVSKWCDAKFLQTCSDEETNSSTSWMPWRWVHFQQILIFGWIIPLTWFLHFLEKMRVVVACEKLVMVSCGYFSALLHWSLVRFGWLLGGC